MENPIVFNDNLHHDEPPVVILLSLHPLFLGITVQIDLIAFVFRNTICQVLVIMWKEM